MDSNQKLANIQQAAKRAMAHNLSEYERAVVAMQQGVDYRPEYKTYEDFLANKI